MSWYPTDGVSFLVRGITFSEPLEVRDVTCFSWQQDVGWPLISISKQCQHDEIGFGPCPRLDWREVMSWYVVGGETYTARVIAQHEPWSIDTPSWWHWDPRGYTSSSLSQRWTWDPSNEGSSHVLIGWRCDVDQWFIWDPGIGSQLRWATRLVYIFGFIEDKPSWGWRTVMSPFYNLLHSTTSVDFQGRGWPGQWSRLCH